MKAEGKGSTSPLRDSFMNPYNRKWVILALFGATAGQGVVWYTGQFYALYYLQTVLNVDFVLANKIVATALLLGTPFFIVFGALSDRIGRKNIILAGAALAAICYIPIYQAMASAAGYNAVTGTSINPDFIALTSLVFVQVFFVTMVYGPIAAFLVELFPVQIRYTSMSLPYHIGNGVFGGLVPLIGTWAVAASRTAGYSWSMYAGLIYPITIAAFTVIIGSLFLKDRRGEINFPSAG